VIQYSWTRSRPLPIGPHFSPWCRGQALLDTVLVLAIVAGTGTALFGVNVLITDAFNWWYHH
jgi:hypothetical protein